MSSNNQKGTLDICCLPLFRRIAIEPELGLMASLNIYHLGKITQSSGLRNDLRTLSQTLLVGVWGMTSH